MTKKAYQIGLWPELPSGMVMIKFFPAKARIRGDTPSYALQIKVTPPSQKGIRTFNFTWATYEERFLEAAQAHYDMRGTDDTEYVLPHWRDVMKRLGVKQRIDRAPRYYYSDRK
jgi:hypothetical protein